MHKLKIYLDTSVISHLDALDAPEKMADTLKLWKMLESKACDTVLSDVVFAELEDCEEPKKSILLASIRKIHYDLIVVDDDTVMLASKFVDFGILKEKDTNDCRHIAAALVSGCDAIASWNFKHIVNAKTIKGTKAIAVLGGYKDIMICTPTMLIEGGIDDD